MNHSDSYHIDNLTNVITYIYRFIIPVLYLAGNIGNLLISFVFLNKSWRKNVCVFYLNACVLFNVGYINSYMFASIFILGWNIHVENSSMIVCKLLHYSAYLFSTLTPTILILASIDRLFVTSKNIDTRLYSSKRLAYLTISVVALFWMIFFCHILVKMTLLEISPSNWICDYDTVGIYAEFVSYSTLLINVTLSILRILLAIFALNNIRQLERNPQQRIQFRSMNKKDFQLFHCLFGHDLVYLLFVTVPSIYTIYTIAKKDQQRTQLEQAIEDFIVNLSTFIHHIPYCASFFIYVTISRAFRQELTRLMHRIIGGNQLFIRQDVQRSMNHRRVQFDVNTIDTVRLAQ
jgi:hypothetical protein